MDFMHAGGCGRRDLRSLASESRRPSTMLGIIAAILFVIAFSLNAASTGDSPVHAGQPDAFGLACLALHLIGVGTSWRGRR
jgi:uncharacterized membrane protein YhdT